MKALKIFLNVNIIFLGVIGVISFATNNVADAIFFIVLALYVGQRLAEGKGDI